MRRGAYQVGSFGDLRWAEWNGRYRDDVRRLLARRQRHDRSVGHALAGSSDLYEHAGRAPYCSINFVTSHDGFTMNDLVSYKDKHNEANGEGNRDGDTTTAAITTESKVRRAAKPIETLAFATDQEHAQHHDAQSRCPHDRDG